MSSCLAILHSFQSRQKKSKIFKRMCEMWDKTCKMENYAEKRQKGLTCLERSIDQKFVGVAKRV